MDNNFRSIIDFIFENINALWVVIISHWVLSFGILLLLLNWVVSLINGSRQQ